MIIPAIRIFDAFLYNGEEDILECRIRELYDLVDMFVVVECGESHLRPGFSRPSDFLKQRFRFRRWDDKITHFFVPELRSRSPISREHEHREKIGDALRMLDAGRDDVVIQSDVDEIPSRSSVKQIFSHLSQVPMIAFAQSLHFFAVDWRYPMPSEMKPVACHVGDVRTFTEMRFDSKTAPALPDGGWHFSWMGTPEDHLRKLDSIYEGDQIQHVRPKLESGELARTGVHVDGVQMAPIDVDGSFPEYVRKKMCPGDWFRPR